MKITELFAQQIQDEVTRQLTTITVRKQGDFPKQGYDLVPKMYVDTAGLAEGSGISSISSGSPTKLTSALIFANNVTWSTTNYQFTIKTPGTYLVSAFIGWAVTGSNQVQTEIYKNGSSVKIFQSSAPSSAGGVTCGGSALLSLVAGDLIDMRAYQTSGGNLSIYVTGSSTWLSIAII